MPHLILEFTGHETFALDAVTFFHPLLETPRVSRRGKSASDIFCRYTFQWTTAVRALCVLTLWTKSGRVSCDRQPFSSIPTLSGGAGTFAASLDYALSKKPLWLLDMFGLNSSGDAHARLLFLRWNAERKRGGEVIIAINPHQLAPAEIQVKLDGRVLCDSECGAVADTLLNAGSFGSAVMHNQSAYATRGGRAKRISQA